MISKVSFYIYFLQLIHYPTQKLFNFSCMHAFFSGNVSLKEVLYYCRIIQVHYYTDLPYLSFVLKFQYIRINSLLGS